MAKHRKAKPSDALSELSAFYHPEYTQLSNAEFDSMYSHIRYLRRIINRLAATFDSVAMLRRRHKKNHKASSCKTA